MKNYCIPKPEKDRLKDLIEKLTASSMVGLGDANREDNCNGYIEQLGDWELRFTRVPEGSRTFWNLRMRFQGLTYDYARLDTLRDCRKYAYTKLLSFAPKAAECDFNDADSIYRAFVFEDTRLFRSTCLPYLGNPASHCFTDSEELSRAGGGWEDPLPPSGSEFFSDLCPGLREPILPRPEPPYFRDVESRRCLVVKKGETVELLQELREWDNHRESADCRTLHDWYRENGITSHKEAWVLLSRADNTTVFLTMIDLCPRIPAQEKFMFKLGVINKVASAARSVCTYTPWQHWVSQWISNCHKTTKSCDEIQARIVRVRVTLALSNQCGLSYTVYQLELVWWVIEFLKQFKDHKLTVLLCVNEAVSHFTYIQTEYPKGRKSLVKAPEDLMHHWYERANPFTDFVADIDVWQLVEELSPMYQRITKATVRIKGLWSSVKESARRLYKWQKGTKQN